MISTDLGLPIAIGRTAEIYAWNDGWVLKLFQNWFELEDIKFEQKIARHVHESGLPVPAVGDILDIEGRNGLLYERVGGQNMWEFIQKHPWRVISLAEKTARLHSNMHANALRPDLPPQHHRLENKLRSRGNCLSESQKEYFLTAFSSLPIGDSICHGDFHPGNILLSPRHAIIIDWIDASLGNPLADLARSSIIMLGATASSQIPQFPMKILVKLFHSVYLRTYFLLRPGGEKEYLRWLPIIAAARLSENIPELKSWLLKTAERGLQVKES
jgi:Ser/Thr protein kinase RdoA (MazF antagonist)